MRTTPARATKASAPGNAMVIVECLTDNPNRTFGDVRACFTKTKSKIALPAASATCLTIWRSCPTPGEDEEAALEALMEADVDVTDIENENGVITVFAPPTEYAKARQALRDTVGAAEFEVDEIQFLPQATTPLEGDDVALFEKLLDMLNDLDDVQNVYHSAELA